MPLVTSVVKAKHQSLAVTMKNIEYSSSHTYKSKELGYGYTNDAERDHLLSSDTATKTAFSYIVALFL